MKRILTIALLILTAVSVCSCNRDYSVDDAKKLVKSHNVKAELISEEDVEKDTIWTFREKGDRGMEFQVIEDHYMTGIDSSTWEASRLYSNYSAVLADMYVDDYAGLSAEVDREYRNGYLYSTKLSYSFTDRDDLRAKTEEAKAFADFLRKKNKENSSLFSSSQVFSLETNYRFEGNFGYSESANAASKDLSYIEDDFLTYALAYYDEYQLSFYSSFEIKNKLESNSGRLYYKNGDRWVPTSYITLSGNTAVPSSTFFHLRSELGLTVIGSPEEYTLLAADGTEYHLGNRYGSGLAGWISFNELKNMTGIEINGKWAIEDELK